MKIWRIEADLDTCIFLLGVGLVPGFAFPALVWLIRILRKGEVHPDYWLGIAVSYGVTVAVFMFLCLVLGDVVQLKTPQQMRDAKERLQKIQALAESSKDPFFGLPYHSTGLAALEVFYRHAPYEDLFLVDPTDPPPPPMCNVRAYRQASGFTSRQFETYRRIVTNFNAVWDSIYPSLNRAYKEAMGTEQDMPQGARLFGIEIGKDEPSLPVGFRLSAEYDQDEYVDVCVRETRLTKAEFLHVRSASRSSGSAGTFR